MVFRVAPAEYVPRQLDRRGQRFRACAAGCAPWRRAREGKGYVLARWPVGAFFHSRLVSFPASLDGPQEQLPYFQPLFCDAPSAPPARTPFCPFARVQIKDQEQQKALATDSSPGAVADAAAVRGAGGDALEGPGPARDVSVRVA